MKRKNLYFFPLRIAKSNPVYVDAAETISRDTRVPIIVIFVYVHVEYRIQIDEILILDRL